LEISLNGITSTKIANLISSVLMGCTSDNYSAAYAIVRLWILSLLTMMQSRVKDIITYMAADTTRPLNDTIVNNTALNTARVNSLSDFETKFKDPLSWVDYINNILVPLTIGSDRSALGSTYNNETIVDESSYGTVTLNPLSTLNEVWPGGL
jgi:hypothetical protein